MAVFDVSRKWRILAPASSLAVWDAADELAVYIGLLRSRTRPGEDRPRIEDAEAASPPPGVPIIILNAAAESRDRNGFTWRIGKDRIEIMGDSDRGLWNGIFDFLAALGCRWPKPGMEELPAPPTPGVYPLKTDRAYHPSAASVKDRRRLVIGGQTTAKERELLVIWAARNKYDALIFSLREKSLWNRLRRRKGIFHIVEYYALVLEAGGNDLSLLLPRSLFLFHQDLFRMDSGKRTRQRHFCPTNPQTITRIKEEAAKLFRRAMSGMGAEEPQALKIFHLWPDSGHEKTWCACPACRAFTPAEQNRIAVTTAADVLEALDPKAQLSYLELSGESGNYREEAETSPADALTVTGGIVPRNNTFILNPVCSSASI
jgi:hypothetical protein